MTYLLILILKLIEAFASTISTLLIIEGKRIIGSVITFFQIIIWFLIIKMALVNNSILVSIFYALGYSIGSFLASSFSNNFFKRKLLFQVITSNNLLLNRLKEKGYSASIISAKGLYGNDNYILFIYINNKRKKELIDIIKSIDSNALISINQNKELINGYFRHTKKEN